MAFTDVATSASQAEQGLTLKSRRTLFTTYLVLLTGLGLLSALIFKFVPSMSLELIREDSYLENATVIGFGLAALATFFFRASNKKGLPRGYLLIGVASVFAILDELSYGQRFFDISFPVLPNGATFDSLSDINRVMTIAFEAAGIPWTYTLGAVALIILLLKGRAMWRFAAEQLRVLGPGVYILGAVGCIAVSALIDTFINPDARLVLLEEYVEFAASISLLFAALAGGLQSFRQT